MRELKFRIWDNDKNEWLAESDDEALTYYGFHLIGEVMTVQSPRKWTVNGVVEQYTCLKDKNGKEVYEGDIVKCYFYGRMIGLYQVIWNEDNAGLELEAIKGNPKNDNIKDTRAFAEMHLFTRVIGNIHENKELLEGE